MPRTARSRHRRGRASSPPLPNATKTAVYGPLIAAQLNQERDRRNSLDTRALTTVQASTGFFTIFAAIITALKGQNGAINGPGLTIFVVAAALFVVSTIFGLISYGMHSGVRAYGGIANADLSEWLKDWQQPGGADPTLAVAQAEYKVLVQLRDKNKDKINWLKAAVIIEVAAAVGVILSTALVIGAANDQLALYVGGGIGLLALLVAAAMVKQYLPRGDASKEP